MSKEDFYSLTPDSVLEAVDSTGFRTTGELLQLNSYENRVFEVALEGEPKIIAKFYRPGRWDEPTLREEHQFLFELESEGLPVVAPLRKQRGDSLFKWRGMWTTLFAKARGRLVQELNPDNLRRLGRTLARMHNIGAQNPFKHRVAITTDTYGYNNLDLLQPWIAPEVRHRYNDAAERVLEFLDHELDIPSYIRIHGDCHKGNLLETDQPGEAKEFFFVDFDDSVMGPEVQDFWMLFSGDENESQDEMSALLSGYEEIRNFDDHQLLLIPGLRGLRIIHYAAWIARRWEDPSFPRLFPQFRDFNYWANETEVLEEISHRVANI